MRVMVTVRVPVETGNRTIKSGEMQSLIGETLERIRPECVYFGVENGLRTMRAVFNLKSESDMVPLLEPMMLQANGALELIPVMTLEDLQAGFKALG